MSVKYHDSMIAAMPAIDTNPIAGSVNAVSSGGVATAIDALKSLTFTIKLTVNGWSNGAQTVNDSNFVAGDYLYTVAPERTSAEAYIATGIYADDVTTDGSMTFHCTNAPEGKLKVTVLRMVSEVIAPPFEWGEDGSAADADWFAELQEAVQNGGANSNWVGLTKSVTLTSAVQDTTTHLIRCIGINQDGNNTITFQTKNCLITDSSFGSAATWSDSTVKTICQSYYNAFPGKNYIKTVSKGTNTGYNTDSVVYTDETVWLPSIYEVGLDSFQYKPVGAEFTNGCSTAYSYYSSDDRRIKYASDSSSITNEWWTRSRATFDSSLVCQVHQGGSATYEIYSATQYNKLAPAFVIG